MTKVPRKLLWLLSSVVLGCSVAAQSEAPASSRGILYIPPIRGGAIWSFQRDIHIPVIYQGNSREITGFNLRLATDTSRLTIGGVQSHVFRSDTDSVTLEIILSSLTVETFPGLNSTVHIRTVPDSTHLGSANKDIIQLNGGDTLFTFTVVNKTPRNFDLKLVPMSWMWLECDDNQLIAPGRHSVSSSVIDYQYNDCIQKLREPNITDTTQSLPTRRGTPAACMSSSSSAHKNARELEFKSGGIYPYSPEVRRVGDANNNFVAFEIDDALVLAQYITEGESALLQSHPPLGGADMNCDNIVSDISDFTLLLRAATGDIMHEFYVADSIAPDTVTFSQDKNILSIDRPAVAALLIFDSEFPVELIAEGLQSDTGVIDHDTHVLVYNLSSDNDTLLSIPAGKLLKTWGVLVDVYAVNYDGYKLHTVISY